MHYPTLLKSISNFAILAAVLAAACSSSRAQSAAPSQNPTTQAAAASPPAMEAPPVLWIERQTVPRANQAAFIDTIHKQLEQFQEHQVVFRVLGLAGAAPSMDEFLFLIHFKSFAEMDEYERKNAAMPAEFQKTMQELVDQELKLSQSHQIIAAVFRADLSYGADAAAVARARLLWTCQFIVPAGHVPEFESDVHFLSDAYQKAGVDDHYFMYQELAGAESQTFIVLHPMKSLADWESRRRTSARTWTTRENSASRIFGKTRRCKVRGFRWTAFTSCVRI